jgi:hypothetical protein
LQFTTNEADPFTAYEWNAAGAAWVAGPVLSLAAAANLYTSDGPAGTRVSVVTMFTTAISPTGVICDTSVNCLYKQTNANVILCATPATFATHVG